MDGSAGVRIFEANRVAAPLRQIRERIQADKMGREAVAGGPVLPGAREGSTSGCAAARQKAQLPTFVPLLEELDVAGWSSSVGQLRGNFHDWSVLDNHSLLVAAGHAVASGLEREVDTIEAALVAQGAWASIRSHAHHAADAGSLLSLAARSLWPMTGAKLQPAVAISIVDLDGGHASVATAGDCLALRVRASGTEQIATPQPLLGADAGFNYVSHSLQLSVRERLVLVADNVQERTPKLVSQAVGGFSSLDAEAHRRMQAADAITIIRKNYEPLSNGATGGSVSIVAVRRR